jgi:hypothetical protein
LHFETDCYCADIGKQLGFKVEKILVPLLRGTSSQQGKKYGELPLRESIVVFQK